MVGLENTTIIAITLGLLLGLVHFWNEKIFFTGEAFKIKSRSFIAGISVAYIFLYLLPDLYRGIGQLNQWVFIFILLGFSLVHFSEKYFYQHAEGEERLFKFKEIHYAVFLLYYFLLGAILLNLLEGGVLNGLLFYVPVLFYAAVSRVSFAEVNTHIREQKFLRLLLSAAALFGVLASGLIFYNTTVYSTLLSFVIGAFLYIAIMDFMPKEARGRPGYFMAGAGLYAAFMVLNLIVLS